MWQSLLYFVLGLVATLLVLSKFVFNPNKRGKNLPPLYNPIPFFGAIFEFARNPVATVERAHKKLGSCFTLHITGFNMTYLIGSEAHEVFFKATDEELSPKEAYRFVVPVFGRGVVYDSPTAVLYEQLKFVKSGLVPTQLKKNVPIMESEAREYFSNWGNSGEVDLLYEMNKLTVLTASRCLLGPEIRADPKVAGEFADLYHDLEGGLNPLAFFFPYAPIPAHFKRDKARVEIQKLFSKVIKQRRQAESDGQKFEDMLQVLMESSYKTGETLDDNSITGLLLALLFAGQHTSGITATWTAFFLGTNKQYLKELLDEQEKIKQEFGDTISFDSLKKSVMLENCIRETLRLVPPLIILMRKVMQPLKYRDIVIPAGDLLCVSPGVATRSPEFYTNPNTYDPHRFDRGEHTSLPYAFLAFGGGRHGCPGENFGILQIKTIWTVLLREFDLEVPGGKMPVPDYTNLVVGPKQPALIRYKRKQVH